MLNARDGLARYICCPPSSTGGLLLLKRNTIKQARRGIEASLVTVLSDCPATTPCQRSNMAENAEQTKKDALYLLDALKYVTSKVEVRQSQYRGSLEDILTSLSG